MDMGAREKEMGFYWMEELNGELSVPMKKKRQVKTKKIEFVGWGSKPLIEFLESIGKDTSKQLSQYEVAAIIKEYVNENKLLHPEKKKRILCDERLRYLFGRKMVARIKVHELLEAHFAENHEESDDELLCSSEENEDNVMISYKKQKSLSLDSKTISPRKKVVETPRSCFAGIVSENIKLVYLKRTLVQDLLKDSHSFEGKVMGSYVRIKSDPNDYSQKNSHQLLQVTGVRKASETGDPGMEILFQVSNFIKDIRICMLSDDNFSEEECEDLRQRVKAGLVKKPTVVELEQKARILHEDITKHWLVREIPLLQNLIDRANEKGWRRELFEYLERKKLLQTPSEQSRLLLQIPKVIVEEVELKPTPQDPLEDVKQVKNHSPKSILRGASDSSIQDVEANQALSTQNCCSTNAAGSRDAAIPSKVILHDSAVDREGDTVFINGIMSMKELNGFHSALGTSKHEKKMEDQTVNSGQQQRSPFVVRNESSREMRLVAPEENKDSQGKASRQLTATPVIELSDDDEDSGTGNQRVDEHPQNSIWHYMDPQGVVQGPFPLMALKRWSDADYFHPDFKVWKISQSKDEAVLLSDVLHRMFPN